MVRLYWQTRPARTEDSTGRERVVKNIRPANVKWHSPEENKRIVLDALRGCILPNRRDRCFRSRAPIFAHTALPSRANALAS